MLKNNMKLILASGSPRRKELLEWSFLPFDIEVSHIDEKTTESKPEKIVSDLACQKARAVYKKLDKKKQETSFVIGSDTIVVFEKSVLEKPSSRAEAREILLKLSNQKHEVFTGVSFKSKSLDHSFYSKTEVHFGQIDRNLLEHYLDTGDSMDKAGAYGIQGAALSFIGDIHGSYSNVVGFPIKQVLGELCKVLRTDYKGLHEIFSSH